MMISTKGRYALCVLIDLAEHQSEGYIPLKDIAKRQEISEKYLESILKIMVRGKLLTGLRGKGGGYKLTKAPEQYTVGSVIRLTEGSLAPVSCVGEDAKQCTRMANCRTFPIWQNLDALINNYLDSVTLADLLAAATPGDDYVI